MMTLSSVVVSVVVVVVTLVVVVEDSAAEESLFTRSKDSVGGLTWLGCISLFVISCARRWNKSVFAVMGVEFFLEVVVSFCLCMPSFSCRVVRFCCFLDFLLFCGWERFGDRVAFEVSGSKAFSGKEAS